jgi:NitT/TauT family transport system substrate-binding protein
MQRAQSRRRFLATASMAATGLHEAGLVRSSPQEIIAGGTDWRFLEELKRALKT